MRKMKEGGGLQGEEEREEERRTVKVVVVAETAESKCLRRDFWRDITERISACDSRDEGNPDGRLRAKIRK